MRAACEVLLELSGPAMILADLLLVPLDRREEWHRYHHLFRDMLLAELGRLRPGLTPVLRRVRPGGAWRTAGLRRRWSTRWRPGTST